ncbi:zf-HC2 domain-containing protein [Lysinibacillus fusiformis]|uniref:zf-HC2 domain-containing protein n=1 Tax=Lysinibacillus fusiformis TaxID=28031 RepID=UPI00119CD5F5|nr:zf-HC2 domain-containing protein [Lysinibacillus fusiformis]
MKKIKCTIIQDVLPLYIDEVVSQDTKEMVDEHLQTCDKCQKEYESMKRDLYIPVENKDSLFNNISKKWRKKKVIVSLISILVTAIILLGVFLYVFYYETVIPYSEDLIKIERQNDNQLVAHYFGESFAGFNGTHPIPLVIDGEKKNVSFIFYTQTVIDSPSRNIRNFIITEKNLNEQEYIFGLPESREIDMVYYVDYDVEKIVDGKDSWNSILKRAELIWEK